MESGQKGTVKKALEAIKAGDFGEAISICKSVLAKDPKCYNAWVFLGKACDERNEYSEAQQAYKKAVELSPDELLAWQGLATSYEKKPPPDNQIVEEVHRKIIANLSLPENKKQEYIGKLCRLLLTSGRNISECIALFENHLINILPARSEWKDTWIGYTSALYQVESSIERVYNACCTACSLYPAAVVRPVEIMLEIHIYLTLCSKQLARLSTMNDVMHTLTELSPNSACLLLSRALLSEDASSCKSVETIDSGPQLASAKHIVLARFNSLSGKHKAVEQICEVALDSLSQLPTCLSAERLTLRDVINKLLITALFKQRKYPDVVKLLPSVSDSAELREMYCIALIHLKEFSKADAVLASCPEKWAVDGYLLLQQKQFVAAHARLLEFVKHHPSHANSHLWLGIACWEMDEHRLSAAQFLLVSAKLDPQCETAFLYLGLYYLHYGQQDRGLKCLRKAHDLNPKDERVCIALVDHLIDSDDEHGAVDILMGILADPSAQSSEAVWLRLGIIRSQQTSYNEAINCFQQALRLKENDSLVWECLADVYLKRGSFTAARRAFENSLELNPQSTYSSYQLAHIKHLLGLHADALRDFVRLLEKNPQYTPALKGLADVHLAMAEAAFQRVNDGKVIYHVEAAVEYLVQAVTLRPDMSCLWKTLGDVLTLTYRVPSADRLRCSSKLISQNSSDLTGIVELDRVQALATAARCYAQAVHLFEGSSHLWHDLAVSHLYSASLSTDSDKKEHLLGIAKQCAQHAIHLDPTVSVHYNLLGVIYMEPELNDIASAQHHLIRSVEVDHNNAQAWTNLAILYWRSGDINLAHQALSLAQAANPKYPECWIGQALVAETLQPNEAMDLFRHTIELGFHVESAEGYAHWVLTTLLNESNRNAEHYTYSIERMEAIPVACDALDRSTRRLPTAQALNAQALLLERQRLYRAALASLRSCLRSVKDAELGVVNAYSGNLARVLVSCGQHREALDQLSAMVMPLGSDCLRIKALALFKMADYNGSYQNFSSLAEQSGDMREQSHYFAAMGMAAVKCGDLENAKTAFFQCSQSGQPSVHGLAALCALGLLTGDAGLALAALQELLGGTRDKQSYLIQTQLLRCMRTLQGDTKAARNALLKAIHCYPLHTALHEQLLTLSISCRPSLRVPARQLAGTVSCVLDLVAAASLSIGRTYSGLIEAQKAVHLFPERSTNWLLLACATAAAQNLALGHVTVQGVGAILTHLVDHVNTLEFNASLTSWLADQALYFKAEHRPTHLQASYQKMISAGLSPQNFHLLAHFIAKDIAYIKEHVQQQPSSVLSWLMLDKMYHSSPAEQLEVLELAKSSASDSSTAMIFQLMMARIVLADLKTHPNSAELKDTFFSLTQAPDAPLCNLLRGMYHLNISKNYRLGIKLLENLVNSQDKACESMVQNFATKYLYEHYRDVGEADKAESVRSVARQNKTEGLIVA